MVFVNEIDSVLRGLSKYLPEQEVVLEVESQRRSDPIQNRRVTVPQKGEGGGAIGTHTATAPKGDRKDRILSVIQEKGQASIKDISEVVTDCSEKTIQRCGTRSSPLNASSTMASIV